ncbi:MAG: sigma-70 family RNA polymerase sigma factor [Flavobacteriales bacterium]|nr:sigma-70 family RNA polymerase sigma factor [Flavobacteriales bacterium]
MNDSQIISGIIEGGNPENTALRLVYKNHFALIRSIVRNNNGSEDEARDVYQEGIIIFYKNIKAGKFRGESAIGSYLYSICRFVWLKHLQKKGRMMTVAAENISATLYEDDTYQLRNRECENLVQRLFEKLGEVCRQILIMTYFEELPMKEIALATGFKDEQNARNKKAKCMNSLRELITQSPQTERMLKELI